MDRFHKIVSRTALLAGLVVLAVYAATKPPATVEQAVQKMLMFNLATRTCTPQGFTASGDTATDALSRAFFARESTEAAVAISSSATNIAALTAIERTNAAVWNIDFGHSYHTREPAAINQMAQVHWVTPTNIAGVLCEDHYVEFSAEPTEAPGMVFNYRDLLGTEYNSEAFTNSYPHLYPLSLPSGVRECYWFRCHVPLAFTNRLRRWNGPARFGGPVGSSYGLAIAGIFLIDDGNTIWKGRTLTAEIGSNTVEWLQGVSVAPLSAMAMSPDSEASHERSILKTLGTPYRYARSLFQPTKINLTTNTITKTTWQGTETYNLAFPIKKKEQTK
ncbi:MAG: hypothetical protein PHI93_10895 [Kiritimatiellae bacterium]|nr:hypothetical protein [Kiritimatiellia bacterium]